MHRGLEATFHLSRHNVRSTVKSSVGENGSGQNGTDKMVWTKWHGQNGMDKMVLDKMGWTKWYGQNGMDKMVYGQNGIGQNGMDKMVWTKWYWTKWYGQNCRDKILRIKSPINPVLIYNMSFSSIPL